jgi:hypothetical protein
MLDTPLHEAFYKSLHKPAKLFDVGRDYRPQLMSYRRRLERAQRFVLDPSAVWEIVERADLDLAHLMDRVQLAMLPFDDIWIEYSQREKVNATYAAGRGPEPDHDVPERVGFLIRRAGGPEQWIATRVSSFEEHSNDQAVRLLKASHGLTMFEYMFDASSPEPIKELGGTRAFLGDLPHNMIIGSDLDFVAVARGLWGAKLATEDDPLEEADKKATIALNPLWKAWFDHKNVGTSATIDLADIIVTEFMEMRGELRFLVVALAIMNEVPILLTDSTPSERRFYGGGRMQPYLTHRTVEINIPAITRKQKSVADYLNVAASKKRRHLVRGHMRRYRDPRGQIVKERWIEAHARGSAELGWVNHDYEVTT